MQVLTFAFILAFIATVHSYPSYIAYDDYAEAPVYPFSGIWFTEEAPVRHKREPHRHRGGYGGYGGGYDGGFGGGFGGFGGYNPYPYGGYQQGFYPQAPIGQASSLSQSSAMATSLGTGGPGGAAGSAATASAASSTSAGSYGYPTIYG